MAVRRSTFARGKWADSRSINAILTDYRAFVGVVEEEVFDIMQEAAEITLSYVLPLVPVETGALYASGKAEAVRTSKGVAAVVSFGGPDNPVKATVNAPTGIVDYAPIVNYDTTKNHPHGTAMFLEKGTLAAKEEVDAYIMQRLKAIRP